MPLVYWTAMVGLLWLDVTAVIAAAAEEPPAFLDDGNEPPVNPFLADSPWAIAHRNSYCQGSSPFGGPTKNDEIVIDFQIAAPVAITLAYSNPDVNGRRALWENVVLYTGKIDADSFQVIDRLKSHPTLDAFSSVYYLIDKDDVFFAGRESSLRSFTNAVAGDPFSGVVKKDEFQLPESALAPGGDSLRGLNILYDGNLVFSTAKGNVGVIGRDFTGLQVISLGEDEEISNSHAVDEDGGIYVVTSKNMYRLQWDGATLSIRWTADYEVGPDQQVGGRLGAGSGSSPSLMGTGEQDKFVVITDGQELMHLVLFWRDEIPPDWQPIAPGKDIRIAAEVPITFGDPNATTSVSEQSVLVRGYGAVVVNNDYGIYLPSWTPEIVNQFMVSLTNLPWWAPYGVEKFEWNPMTRTLESAWANNEISCPNGIPTMSAASNLMYCVGQRHSIWNIEAVDWDTGESSFYKKLGFLPKFNSAYAAIQVGQNRELVGGTATGVIRARVSNGK